MIIDLAIVCVETDLSFRQSLEGLQGSEWQEIERIN